MSLTRSLFNNPNSIFSGFNDLFFTDVPATLFTDIPGTPFLLNVERDPKMILRHSSPCYEVTENENAFQLSIDVPGVKSSDIDARLENDNRVLRITGGRKVKTTDKDGRVETSESRFEKKFVLDQSVDPSKITANLAEGVLTIEAPKLSKKEESMNKIMITEGPAAATLT
eukprot:850816_1